jgi:hypothetical protein
MKTSPHFDVILKELLQEAIFKDQKILCLDVLNILVKKLNLYEIEVFNML